MGTQSKTKANKAGVAKKPSAVLGAPRAKLKGGASSARSTKAKTKDKNKVQGKTKGKAKSKTQVEVTTQNVARPDYYPYGMLEFIDDNKLTFIEGDILKRLVRLEKKDKQGDLLKLQELFWQYYHEERTREQVLQITKQWTALVCNHENSKADEYKEKGIPLWELDFHEYNISWYAEKFIAILCMESRVAHLELALLKQNITDISKAVNK